MKCLLPLDKQCENIVVSYFHSIADFIFFIISHLFLSRLCSLTSQCITCYSFCVHTFNNWDSRLIKSVYDVTFAQYQSTRMKSARQTWIIKSNCMKEKSVRANWASEQKIWRKITANDKIYISSSIHRHSVIHHGFAPNKIWKWIWICTFPPVAIATTPRAATPWLLGHVYLTRTEGFFLARVKLLCWVLSVHFGNNFFLLTDFMPKLVPNNFIAEKWKEISKTPQFLVHSDALRYKDSHENRINNWQREWRKSFFYTRMTF